MADTLDYASRLTLTGHLSIAFLSAILSRWLLTRESKNCVFRVAELNIRLKLAHTLSVRRRNCKHRQRKF